MPQAALEAAGLHSPALFALSVLLMNATPGVDLLCVLGRTLTDGRRAGLAAAVPVRTAAFLWLGAWFVLQSLLFLVLLVFAAQALQGWWQARRGAAAVGGRATRVLQGLEGASCSWGWPRVWPGPMPPPRHAEPVPFATGTG